MKTLAYILILLLGINSALASGHRDNGGNSIFCEDVPDAEFTGHFTFDYLASLHEFTDLTSVHVESIESQLDKTKKMLKAKMPLLAESFEKFHAGYMKPLTIDEEHPRSWTRGRGKNRKLVDLNDHFLRSVLPENCSLEKIKQAVRRQKKNNGDLIYHYDHKILFSDLKENSKTEELGLDFQLSLLVHHEWLWDLNVSVEIIYLVNKYLHSERFYSVSAEQVGKDLRKLDLPAEWTYTPDEHVFLENMRVQIFQLWDVKPSPVGSLYANKKRIMSTFNHNKKATQELLAPLQNLLQQFVNPAAKMKTQEYIKLVEESVFDSYPGWIDEKKFASINEKYHSRIAEYLGYGNAIEKRWTGIIIKDGRKKLPVNKWNAEHARYWRGLRKNDKRIRKLLIEAKAESAELHRLFKKIFENYMID